MMTTAVTVVVSSATDLVVAVDLLVMASPVVVAVRGRRHIMFGRGCLLLLAQQCERWQRRRLHRQPR